VADLGVTFPRSLGRRAAASEDGATASSVNGEGSLDWRHWTRLSSLEGRYVLQHSPGAVTVDLRRALAMPAARTLEPLARQAGTR